MIRAEHIDAVDFWRQRASNENMPVPIAVLVLTRYGRRGASSRIRFEKFIDEFERGSDSKFSFTLAPLLDDSYLEQLYQGRRRSVWYLFKRYLARLRLLLSYRRFDTIWVEKEIFPGAPALAERLLSAFGARLVVDFDDATFLTYENSSNVLVQRLLGNKISHVVRSAKLITAGNGILADELLQRGAPRASIMPSVVDTAAARAGGSGLNGAKAGFTIGWIGTPSNVQYLNAYRDAIADAQQRYDAKFMTIGAPPNVLPGIRQDSREWSEHTEFALISEWDVALAPINDGPWERCKSAYKVLQCMAVGIPVIASPVGVIPNIVNHGVNGFLAEGAQECRAILDALARDPELHWRIAQHARQTVARQYSVRHLLPDISRALEAQAMPGNGSVIAVPATAKPLDLVVDKYPLRTVRS